MKIVALGIAVTMVVATATPLAELPGECPIEFATNVNGDPPIWQCMLHNGDGSFVGVGQDIIGIRSMTTTPARAIQVIENRVTHARRRWSWHHDFDGYGDWRLVSGEQLGPNEIAVWLVCPYPYEGSYGLPYPNVYVNCNVAGPLEH